MQNHPISGNIEYRVLFVENIICPSFSSNSFSEDGLVMEDNFFNGLGVFLRKIEGERCLGC